MYAIGSMRTGPHLARPSKQLAFGFSSGTSTGFLNHAMKMIILLFFLSVMHFSAQPNFALKAKDTCVTKAAWQEESCEWK